MGYEVLSHNTSFKIANWGKRAKPAEVELAPCSFSSSKRLALALHCTCSE